MNPSRRERHCPICGEDYFGDVSDCPVCQVPLVEDFFAEPEEEEIQRFVPVGRALNEVEIALIKSQFDALGIRYYLLGENASRLVPLPMSVKVMVHEEDLPEAEEIIREWGFT